MFATAPPYVFTEDTLHLPISAEEVDRYLNAGGRPFSRHRRMKHLLWRVRTTLAAQQRDILDLGRTIEKLNEARARAGTPTTLNPMDALRFAAPEDLEKVVDRHSRGQLQALRRLVEEWTAQRNAMVTDLARIRNAATIMVNRTDLPASVRAEFARLLAEVPTEAPPQRDTPHVLRLEDYERAQLPPAPPPVAGQLAAAPHQPAPAQPSLAAHPAPSQPAAATPPPAGFTAPAQFTPPAR